MLKKTLPISAYQHWFDMLQRNKAQKVENLLNSLTAEDQNTLVNGSFDYDGINTFFKSTKFRLNLPFHIAVSTCSKDIVRILLKKDVEVFGVDHKKYNALHACVVIAFFKPNKEEKICDMIKWLAGEIPNDAMSKLLLQENKKGYRPLEFATQHGCLKIMKTFLESGCHVTESESRGLLEHRCHDVTEYETGSRQNRNPVNMLPYLDDQRLKDINYNDVILSPIILNWIDAKISSNIPMVVCWLFVRLSFVLMYFFIDSDVSGLRTIHGNQSDIFVCKQLSYIDIQSYTVKLVLYIAIIVYILLTLFLDIIEYCMIKCGRFESKVIDFNGVKTIVSSTFFYIITNTIIQIVVLFNFVIFLLVALGVLEANSTIILIISITRSMIPVMMSWTLLYFMQLAPYIGTSVLSIQHMNIELIRFSILYIIMNLPFVHAFESYVMIHSETGCVDGFSSVYKSFYTLFLVMLNAYDLTALPVNEKVTLTLLHILFVFMVAILVVNFLIAVMSSKADQIAGNEKVLLKLNQLALVVRLEDRIFWCTKWIYKCLRRNGFQCKEGKVFIMSEFCRIDENSDESENEQ